METTLKIKNIKDRVDSVYSGKAYTHWMDKVQAREMRASKAFQNAFYANIEANIRKDMYEAVQGRDHDLNLEALRALHKAQEKVRQVNTAFERAVKAYDKMFEDKKWGGYAPEGLSKLDKAVDYKLLERVYSGFSFALSNIGCAGTDRWNEYYAPIATSCSQWNDFHTHIREAKIVARNGGDAI